MKVKIFAIIVILVMIIGSFGAIGTQTEIDENFDCGCNANGDNNGDPERGLGIIDSEDHDAGVGEIFSGDPPRADFDWRNKNGKNYMTKAKSQGGCGSCWAFATVGVIEAVVNIKNNDPNLDLDLSEQYMVSCCPDSYSAYGCDGAISKPLIGDNYLEWARYFDAIPESKFDYSGTDESCSHKSSDFYKYKVEVTSWKWVDGDTNNIKNALVQKGPLHATMDIYDDFYNDYPNQNHWPNDVYYHKYGDKVGGHAVIIVGYGSNYWICKNSWGTSWGIESGYFKIKFGEVGIQDDVAYITCAKYVDPDEATVSFEVYKIKAIDDLDWSGFPYYDEEDWCWNIEVDGESMTDYWEEHHNTITKVQSYHFKTSKDVISIIFRLREIDDWPSNDDIADIGDTHGSEPYDDDERDWKNYPDCVDFDVILDRNEATLQDALSGDQYKTKSESGWSGYYASGGFDSGSGDENDCQLWFNIKYKQIAPPGDLVLTNPSLTWTYVPPGSTVQGSFKVKNDGASGSELNWEIDDCPSWGTWTFNPSRGSGLKSGESNTVQVTVKAPNEPLQEYSGNVKVVNTDNSADYATLPVYMMTPRNKFFSNQMFMNLLNNFPLLKDILLSTLIK